jgi:hypothetical protein
MSIKHAPSEPAGQCSRGNGKQNVQTIFLTASGEIFHAATGFLSAEDLFDEMEFAQKLFEQIRSAQSPASLVAGAHAARLKEEGFSDKEIRSRFPFGSAGLETMMNRGTMMNRRPGSGTRNAAVGQGSSSKNGVFGSFIRKQFLSDNKFSIDHPMLEVASFEKDPGKLIGRGGSFFASSSSGGR